MIEQLQIGSDFTAVELLVMARIGRGRDNAVPMPTLAGLVDISTRELQSIIAHLIEDHGVLISSATGKNHGYYYPASEAEFKAGALQLEHRIISLAKRLRALNKESYEAIFGQGRLEEVQR